MLLLQLDKMHVAIIDDVAALLLDSGVIVAPVERVKMPGFAELDELQKKLYMDEMTRVMTGWPSLSTFT